MILRQPRHTVFFGVAAHGAELDDLKRLPVERQPLLFVKHRAVVVELDGDRGQQHHGRRDHDGDGGQHNIHRALGHFVDQARVGALAAVDRHVHKLDRLAAADDCVGDLRFDICNLGVGDAKFDHLVAVVRRHAAKKHGVQLFEIGEQLLEAGLFGIDRAYHAKPLVHTADALERQIGVHVVEHHNRLFRRVKFEIDRVDHNHPPGGKQRIHQEHQQKRPDAHKLIAQKRKDNIADALQKRDGDHLGKDQIDHRGRADQKAAVDLDKRAVDQNKQHKQEIVAQPVKRRGGALVEPDGPQKVHARRKQQGDKPFEQIQNRLFLHIVFSHILSSSILTATPR